MYEQAMSKFWAYWTAKKIVEPRIYDRRDSAKLAGLPQEVRHYLKSTSPLLMHMAHRMVLNRLISARITDTGWMSGINILKR